MPSLIEPRLLLHRTPQRNRNREHQVVMLSAAGLKAEAPSLRHMAPEILQLRLHRRSLAQLLRKPELTSVQPRIKQAHKLPLGHGIAPHPRMRLLIAGRDRHLDRLKPRLAEDVADRPSDSGLIDDELGTGAPQRLTRQQQPNL